MGYSVPNRVNERGCPPGPVTMASEEVRLAMLAKYCTEPIKHSKPKGTVIEIKPGTSERVKRGIDNRQKHEVSDKKLEFLKEIATGLTIIEVERKWNMKKNTLYYWVKKWDLIGINPKRAREILASRG